MRQNLLLLDTSRKTCPQTCLRNREIRVIQEHWMPIKPPKEMTRNSPVRSPILLRRKLPIAWGTTIDRVTAEINPFPYSREIKHITLKDLETHLILDGWCRSPLSFSNPSCVNNLLSQQSANKKIILYNYARPTLAYIIN